MTRALMLASLAALLLASGPAAAGKPAAKHKPAAHAGAPAKRTQAPPASTTKERTPSAAASSESKSGGGSGGSSGSDDGDGASKTTVAAPAAGGKKVTSKTYTFGAMDVEGKLKTPQLLYFLNRVKLELDMSAPDKRSFMKELQQSADDKNL